MRLFAIGDLHLSLGTNKPMDIFGPVWCNHTQKIKENWLRCVTEEDTVILAGDTSWATRMEEARLDMEFLMKLPGTKILLRGNHDYWWTSYQKLTSAYHELYFLQNNFFDWNGYALCGTRGWSCPNDMYFQAGDEKIYNREAIRLRLSLESALKSGYDKIIVSLHYPPTNDKKEQSLFLDVIESYPQIQQVIYGHLHGEESFHTSILGMRKSVLYRLVSADYVDFTPVRIL